MLKMCVEDVSRSFCRENVDKVIDKTAYNDPRKHRNPLPFNLKNPYTFTAKFFVISTIGFALPYGVVLYQMYKSGKSSS